MRSKFSTQVEFVLIRVAYKYNYERNTEKHLLMKFEVGLILDREISVSYMV
jgi:hypothetical protein